MRCLLVVFLVVGAVFSGLAYGGVEVSGQLRVWHKVSLTFDGPDRSERGQVNPFADHRLDVEFRQGQRKYVAAGYFAADGNAGQSGAGKGNKWRVHFVPDAAGKWEYTARFASGKDIAIGGSEGDVIGRGSFKVKASDKKGRDFRAKGMLRYVGQRYLRFASSGEYFIKGGADSPENFLGYHEFDGTYDLDGGGNAENRGSFLHEYAGHVKDWRDGDPTWQGARVKELSVL